MVAVWPSWSETQALATVQTAVLLSYAAPEPPVLERALEDLLWDVPHARIVRFFHALTGGRVSVLPHRVISDTIVTASMMTCWSSAMFQDFAVDVHDFDACKHFAVVFGPSPLTLINKSTWSRGVSVVTPSPLVAVLYWIPTMEAVEDEDVELSV
tara:strand:- start:376 stop:840 length:465 start_codon:yes stop_codon:yes gene_type:complete